MTEQLKPCPFCGGLAKAYERTCDKSDRYDPSHRAYPIVRCGSCGCCAEGKDWTEPDTAIEAWNRRAQTAQAGAEPVAWVVLQKTADEIVRSKSLWKRFIDGTPLENDIACWMADFAQQFSSHPPARVPLTDGELRNISKQQDPVVPLHHNVLAFARAIEAAHGIGGDK